MCTKEEYLKGQKASGIKVGDEVKVIRKADSGEKGWGNSWISSMDQFIGCTLTVSGDAGTYGLELETTNKFKFPYFVLEKVNKETRSVAKEEVLCTSEVTKVTDDNGVELLPGDVVAVWDDGDDERYTRVFKEKRSGTFYCFYDGRFFETRVTPWKSCTFYARPPAKQKYVRSRKEVAQILLDEGYEPDDSGDWFNSSGCSVCLSVLKDCGKKLSDCRCYWDEKFLIEK